MLEKIKNNIAENKVSFILSAVSAVVALVSIIVYASTGIIKGFTESYSAPLFIFAILGLVVNLLNLVKRIDTVETFAFTCYFIAMIFFFTINANYLVAVTRAIDVTSVNGTFVFTLILIILAWATSLAALIVKGKKN